MLWVMIVMDVCIGLGFVGPGTIGLRLDETDTGGFNAGRGRLLNLALAMAVSR